jgi:hypothetical protein
VTDAGALPDRDRQELTDLIVEHAWLLDHDQWHQVADLYLDDGSMIFGDTPLQGRSALLAWADARAQKTTRHTHHQCTNIRLRADSDCEATGTVMLILHACEGGDPPRIELVGEYRDHYRRDPSGRWRIAKRQLLPLNRPPSAEPHPAR